MKHFLSQAIILAVLLFSLQISFAQRPPTQYDKATVTRLIQEIDAPRNAEWLKVLYFGRRKPKPGDLPIETGWALLKQSASDEKTGTLRWFHLQSVVGAVAYRLPVPEPDAGIAAYNVLFDNALQAPAASAEYILRASINEFILSLDDPIKSNGEVADTFVQAWQAYVVSLSYTDHYSGQIPPLDWLTLFEQADYSSDIVPLVKRQVTEAKEPSYELLSAAAWVTAAMEPEQAVDYLVKARPLLPRLADGQLDNKAAKRYYMKLIRLYEVTDQQEKAKEAKQESMALLPPIN